MLAVLSYQRASLLSYQPPEEVLGGILILNLFMVIVGVGLAVLLSVFAAKSVSEPLERLKEGINKVGEGETSVRVSMRANDEIGNVTEGFNRMVNSLDEKRRSIRELTQNLENKVKDRTIELEHALDEKENTQAQLVHSEKMASLGQLVAGVAHEINNPIGFIYANTDNLERQLAKMRTAFENGDNEAFEIAEEKMLRLVKSTGEGAKRTKEIVQGLRSFSRKDPAAKGPVDVHEILETAVMLLGHEFKHGIELKRQYGQIKLINGNAGELSQVFMNIMINAVQAMEEKGTLTVTTDSDDKFISVKIEDTGSGINPDNIEHLFEPFFTTKDVGSGTGLGLAIVYGIVKSHGGDIKVNSVPEKGTTMEILLPYKENF
jgi:two-component system, NtrC family, sensor kinase